MQELQEALRALGWNEQLQAEAAAAAADTVARVAAVDRDRLLLLDAGGSFPAKLAGRFRHRHPLPEDMPCVGDWVCLERPPGSDFALVLGRLGRRTCLGRRGAGKTVDRQLIAANVDVVFIVQSCHFDFNPRRLERYLVMVMDGGAEARILLTKSDLVPPETLASQLETVRAAGIAAPLATLSNLTGEGLERLRQSLVPGKTYCFVGSSGVGKSTLINGLIGHDAQETGQISGSGEGRHTTVRRELIRLAGGALVIDSPGMREFGIVDAEAGLEGNFADIGALASGCRYRDCSHSGEPGCAVQAAVEAGRISREHLESRRKLQEEADFHQLSHAQKRKKDRDFGRYIKSVKKELKGR